MKYSTTQNNSKRKEEIIKTKRGKRTTHLAKLLKAADCGLMQSGTRPVCNCSAINLCISSVERKIKD